MNEIQKSNLITFYDEQSHSIKLYGTDNEYEEFCNIMDNIFECLEVEPYFEDDHLVDLREF